MITVAYYKYRLTGEPLLRRMKSRLGSSSGFETRELRERLVLPHIVSVVEDFVATRLWEISASVDKKHEMFQSLWKKAEKTIESNWERRIEAYSNWHTINLRDCDEYSTFEGYVQARNAIMHGLGQLTKRQMRDASRVLAELGRAGIKTNGRTLVFPGDVVEQSATIGNGVITWLDKRTHKLVNATIGL